MEDWYIIDNLSCMRTGLSDSHIDRLKRKTINAAIVALEELKQYREIGTVEECREAVGGIENE